MSDKATKESYSQQAADYERTWKRYLQHTHATALKNLDLQGDEVVLDVSAGTGLFQQYMVEHGVSFRKMILNDLSEGMMEFAIERFSEDSRFEFTHQDVAALEFPNEAFDHVISLNAFHNYKSQQEAVKEFSRVLKPGAELLILDWNHSGPFKLINYIIDLFTSEFIKTKSAADVEVMLRNAGFNVVERKEWWFGWWKFFLFRARK
ncbi:class I SAM-dependent methyltransferase [Gracilimonas tropica]|uniref:class I SAM-dependent methyltransferase n=1 Tax=Gracilimonas tropica TaxID=454600 RepID=UPI00036CB7DD|nr:class I SAM-dependent methyltransferase [Gracilimonas tropica]